MKKWQWERGRTPRIRHLPRAQPRENERLAGAFESYKLSMEQGNSWTQTNYDRSLVNGIGTVANAAVAFCLETERDVVQDLVRAGEYISVTFRFTIIHHCSFCHSLGVRNARC
jgi:hypothetical protein